MSQYSWLGDKKREAMAVKMQRRGMPSYAQLPIRERYGVSYTGLGPDGNLDRRAPVGMSGGAMLHEGEMRARVPEGVMALDANTTKMAYPETNQQQAEMKLYERSGNLPGLAAGGGITDANSTASDITNDIVQTASVSRDKPAGIPMKVKDPTITPRSFTRDKPAGIQMNINPDDYNQTVDTRAVTRNDAATDNGNDDNNQIITVKPVTRSKPEGIQMNINPDDYNQTVDTRTVTRDDAATDNDNTASDKGPPVINPDDIVTIPPGDGLPAGVQTGEDVATAEDIARQAGMDYLSDSLNKEDDANMLEARRALDELSLRHQEEISALEQQMAQQGVDPGRARLEIRALRDRQESERNDLAARYGIAGMQLRNQNAVTLATQGLAGQRFEQEKAEYGNTEGWRAYEAAIVAGDFTTAAQAYKDVTGNDINMEQMRTYQNYLNAKNEQDLTLGNINITAGELQNEATRLGIDADRLRVFIDAVNGGADLATANAQSGLNLTPEQFEGISRDYAYTGSVQDLTLANLRNQFGDALWDSIQDMINKGMDLSRINERLKEQGKDPLGPTEYQNMLDATPRGERNWGRKLSAANMLLTTPGAGNKNNAAELYEELFPGIGIDFNDVIVQENAENFANGLSDLAAYIAADMDMNSAITALKDSGKLELMGISEGDAEYFYNSMKVNAIDEEWQKMEDSDFWDTLSTEEQDEQREFFRQKMLGNLDYDTLHEYEITDAQGNYKTTIYGKDSTEADKYAAKYGYTVEDTGNVKFTMSSTITKPDEPTDTEGTEEKDAYEAFKKTLPEGVDVEYDDWVKMKNPETYDDVGPLDKLKNFDIEDYSEMLSKDNSDMLFAAQAEDPEAFRQSEFYYERPIADSIITGINYEKKASGRKITLTDEFKSTIENNIGKYIELPDNGIDGAISGQLEDYKVTLSTVQLKIKKSDGTYVFYTIFQAGSDNGDMYNVKVYGNDYSRTFDGSYYYDVENEERHYT